jgi:hypothetical protein
LLWYFSVKISNYCVLITQAANKVVVETIVAVIATDGTKEATGVSHTLTERTIGEEKAVATALQAGA